MTTHRAIQLSVLQDDLSSRARVCRSGAANLRRIGNAKGADYQDARAVRFERIANRAAALLAKDQHRRDLEEAAKRWDNLADEEERMAAWEASIGFPYGVNLSYSYRAALYRKTAKSMRAEAELGEPVCIHCLNPYDDGRYGALQRHACKSAEAA